MQFKIRCEEHGMISFWINGDAGYVFLESPDKPGQLGRQIAKGGDFMGSMLLATAETMEAVCRRWHKQRLQIIAKSGEEYGNGGGKRRKRGRPALHADQVAKVYSIRMTEAEREEYMRRGGNKAFREWLRS